MTSRPSERFAGLDGLRAFAVALVVWHNFGALPFTKRFGHAGELRAGYIGVTVFFTISGFLITHLLIAEWVTTGRIRIVAFYLRRAFRLLPALLVAIAILVATAATRHHPWSNTLGAAAAALGYVFNFAAAHAPVTRPLGGAGWGHLWSLSVEEQFYLAWPLLLIAVFSRVSFRPLMAILLFVVAAITTWRTALWFNDASFFRLYLMTDVRIDAIFVGSALAIAVREYPWLRIRASEWRWTVGPSLVALLVLAHRGSGADPAARPGWLLGPGMLIVALLSALIILVVTTSGSGFVDRLLDSGAARAIGRRSYGIYLFHYPVEALLGDRPGGWFLSLLATALATEVSYRFIEVPTLRRLPTSARRAVSN